MPSKEKSLSQSPRPLKTEESNYEGRGVDETARIYATRSGARKIVDNSRVIVTSGDRLITTMGNTGNTNFYLRQNANLERM